MSRSAASLIFISLSILCSVANAEIELSTYLRKGVCNILAAWSCFSEEQLDNTVLIENPKTGEKLRAQIDFKSAKIMSEQEKEAEISIQPYLLQVFQRHHPQQAPKQPELDFVHRALSSV